MDKVARQNVGLLQIIPFSLRLPLVFDSIAHNYCWVLSERGPRWRPSTSKQTLNPLLLLSLLLCSNLVSAVEHNAYLILLDYLINLVCQYYIQKENWCKSTVYGHFILQSLSSFSIVIGYLEIFTLEILQWFALTLVLYFTCFLASFSMFVTRCANKGS